MNPSTAFTSTSPLPSPPPSQSSRPHRTRFTMRILPLKLLNGRTTRVKPTQPSSTSTASTSTTLTTTAAHDLSAELRSSIQHLYVSHITPDGSVDYISMRSSSAFAHYVSLTSRLPHLDLSTALPDDAHKIAFFVNLYNAATQHAVTSCGPPPANALLRLWFGVRVGYAVGGYALSLHDMENGILRNNRSVSILPPPFSKNDPRRVLCVRKPDPRIHFVLNCAASSCPPVLYLTPSKLEHVLAMAARGFLADVNNFDVVDRCVYLSQIFKWYLQDFSADGSERGMLYFIVANGDLKQPSIRRLEEMLRRITGEIPIFWRRYDWSLNGVS